MSDSKLFFLFFFFFSFAAVTSSFNHTIHKCSQQQRDALLLFKQNISSLNETYPYYQYLLSVGDYPVMKNWKTSIDCCNWNGVTCNRFTGDVIGLDLSRGMLRGTIHPNSTLFQLPRLQRLNLAFNRFTNTKLPHEITRFSNSLTHLNISDCEFIGQIPPEISLLSKLVSLDLSSNYGFEFEPYAFNNLLQNTTHLRDLVMSDINMSAWVLPTYLNISSSLKTLDLSDTDLQGKFPDNIFYDSPCLEKLVLSFNINVAISLPKVNMSTKVPLKWLDLTFTNSSSRNVLDSIFHLKSLNYLSLSCCSLVGTLPNSLINLSHLVTLDLSYNMFNGTLPSFLFTLPLLQNVNLRGNMFTGGLPTEFFNCQSLRELDFRYNQFDGEINAGSSTPPSFIQLTNLVSVKLSYNNFKGFWDLDTLFSTLQNLTYLDLSDNGFSVVTLNRTGYVNPDFEFLGLASCKLTVFPESIRAMKNLYQLDLSGNYIRGRIPDYAREIGRNNLYYLNLSNNSITGLPQFLWDQLSELYLQSNKIQGLFPSSICNMTNLRALDISNNSFSGVIPQCLGNISTLYMMNLGTNHFHGAVPNMCKDNELLEGILLNGNQLGGGIPTSLSNCSSLKVLDLGNNHLNGTFPGWLGDLPKLQVLALKSNHFHGSIDPYPKTEFPFPCLQVLDLSKNQLRGHLPWKFFQNFDAMKDIRSKGREPEYLFLRDTYYSIVVEVKGYELSFQRISVDYTIIDLSNNRFEGEIPNVIGSLNSLVVLNLSHNNLNGRIPHDLGNLSGIESLDLSWNRLTGEIPQSLVDITNLEVLSLVQNNLVGRIPEGKQFNTFDQSSYWGNPKLCGVPLPKQCEHQHSSQLVEADEDGEENAFTWKVVMSGYGCGIMLGLVMGYLMLSTGRPKWFNSIVDAGEHMIQTKQKKRTYVYIGK